MTTDLALFFDLAGIAFFLSILFTPVVRRAALRWNIVDRPDGHRKLHREPIPRVGGIAVTGSYLLTFVFILFLPYRHLDLDLHKTLAGAIALAPAVTLVFVTGLIDDIVGLRPWQKLIGQVVAALLAYSAGFGIHIFRGHPLSLWVSLPVSILWLVGSANALNLIDGMDGLAAGIGFCAAFATFIAAVVKRTPDLALITAPLAGSLLGFLRFNFNPASIFLGDCGSLVIGFLLGCYGALLSDRSVTSIGLIAPVMAMSVPLLDVLISIARRFLRDKPIFSADKGHIHHRLLDRGFTPKKAALVLYGVSGLAACFSLLQELTVSQFHAITVVVFCIVVWIGVSRLNYPEFGMAQRMIFGRGLRRTIDIQIRLQQFTKSLAAARDVETVWLLIRDAAKSFGFYSIRLNVTGQSYEATFSTEATELALQVCVPLGPSEDVSFTLSTQMETHEIIVQGFANAVQQGLMASAEGPRTLSELGCEFPLI